MKNKKLFWMVFTSVAIFAVVLVGDLLTKHFIFKLLPHTGNSMDVMPGFINFIHVENKGAAWGFMAGRPIFLIVVSLAILALYVAFYVIKLKHLKNSVSPLLAISAGFIVGGCIGNLVDRLAFGYVRDFINFQFFNFPVFNFADIAVTISVVLMVIYLIFVYPKESDVKKIFKKTIKNEEKTSNIEEKNDIIVENLNSEAEKDDQNKSEDKDEGWVFNQPKRTFV